MAGNDRYFVKHGKAWAVKGLALPRLKACKGRRVRLSRAQSDPFAPPVAGLGYGGAGQRPSPPRDKKH